ncbi:hypothetical protein TIFTF001_020104 [Ficus carica]|uniref:Uncharacterized protein n=1 Tax=Ficus carica TaxID=3494 RepID=A0AA88AA37_FICCA|nr:hypothetical protein TIFTF001_020104 [Ficus carica]
MMKKTSSSEKTPLKKGAWSPEEDRKLVAYIKRYKIWNWSEMSKAAGLARSGKSCRLRWVNYLRPDIKHGNFSEQEKETIITLHETLGNRWSAIAAKLPGRTDNEVKNYWHTHLKKRLKVDSASTVLGELHKVDDETSAKNLSESDHLLSSKPAESMSILKGTDNAVVSPRLMSSTDNPSSVLITSSAPTSCGIGKDGKNVIESIIDNTSSETLNFDQELQSLWTKPDIVGNGDFFDLDNQLIGPSGNPQEWQQDSIWPSDFYKGYDYYDWIDDIDKIFGT